MGVVARCVTIRSPQNNMAFVCSTFERVLQFTIKNFIQFEISKDIVYNP